MPTRIPASERASQKLDEQLRQGVADGDARAELLKLAVRKIVKEALEAEVAEAVGRGYYDRGAAPGAGYRNGYRRGRLRTAEGAIEYGVGPDRGTRAPRCRNVRPGLSTRDVEAAFRDATGVSLLSRTAVSQVTERLWREYEAFAARDPSEFAVAYFFVDGVAERLHAGLPARRCSVPGHQRGRPAGVGSTWRRASRKIRRAVTAFFEDLKRRGLTDPLLTVTDGAPGLIRAVETCSPGRCASAAWSTGCGICGARSRRVSGPRSGSGPAPAAKRPRRAGPAAPR